MFYPVLISWDCLFNFVACREEDDLPAAVGDSAEAAGGTRPGPYKHWEAAAHLAPTQVRSPPPIADYLIMFYINCYPN
jgi:hypothetical protein